VCRRVYGVEGVTKTHRISLTDSLKKILPPGWKIGETPGREHFVFNEVSALGTLLWWCWLRGMSFDEFRASNRIKNIAYDAAGTFVKFSRDNAAEDIVKLEADIGAALARSDLTSKDRAELSQLTKRLRALRRRMGTDARARVGTEDDGFYLDGNDWIARRYLDAIRAEVERIRAAKN
jgi:hypothetical protein